MTLPTSKPKSGELAPSKGERFVVVNAGDLHRRAGGYPGANHRMPVCFEVMRRLMASGDEIRQEPPRGNGATLTILYRLPR